MWITDTDGDPYDWDDYFRVTCTSWADNSPNWSPNGSRLVFTSSTTCDGCFPPLLTTIDPDGTDRATLSGVTGQTPAWSPDGSKIAYSAGDSVPRIKTVNADGTNIVDLAEGHSPDWQPIPINSYPRPKGATPLRASLTTAYNQCTAPNRTHGPPLAFPSCASPQKTSSHLTVGTGDSNGLPARNEGYLRSRRSWAPPAAPTTPMYAIGLHGRRVHERAGRLRR